MLVYAYFSIRDNYEMHPEVLMQTHYDECKS